MQDARRPCRQDGEIAGRRQRFVTFAERIKVLRKERGWTQSELARQVGIHEGNICRWEKGQNRPAGRTLEKVAEAFGLSVEELFGPRAEEQLANDVLRRQFLEIQDL